MNNEYDQSVYTYIYIIYPNYIYIYLDIVPSAVFKVSTSQQKCDKGVNVEMMVANCKEEPGDSFHFLQ